MTDWTLQPILQSYPAVAVAGGVLLLLLLVGPAYRPLRPRQRGVLIGLRLLVSLLVVAALLRPGWISTQARPQTATVVLLADQSRSLQVPDAGSGKTRWQALRDALQQAAPELARLSNTAEIRAYTFDRRAQPVEFTQGELTLPDEPSGDQTDLGSALDDVLRRELGQHLAAVILLSDGAQRAYAPRVEAQQAARELARSGSPLFTVALGQPRDRSQSRDVAIVNLQDQYTVFVQNELVVRGGLNIQGYVNQPIPVQLDIAGPDGATETLGPVAYQASEDNTQVEVQFTYVPRQPGQHRLTLAAAEQPGELVVDNNQLTAFLTVREGGLRVLYLDSNLLGAEQKFIRLAVGSAPDVQLDFRPVDSRLADRWPIDLEPQWAQGKYDVYLLGDVDSTALGEANLRQLAAHVEEGRGLMMLGGYHTFGPGGYDASPLADALPVEAGRFERQDPRFGAPLRRDVHLDQDLSLIPTSAHFVTHLAPGAENAAAWRRLKPLTGANKFARLKPRAMVLAESPDKVPLLVAGEYGLGRVLAFAGDSTYRWWLGGQQAQHKRFWRQAVLWLARRDQSLRDEAWIQLDQRRYHPGAPVSFTAGARGPEGEAIGDAQLTALVQGPGIDDQPVRLTRDGDQWAGVWPQTQTPGDYVIQVQATRDGMELGSARAKFLVFTQDLEMSDPAADPQLLSLLARLTAEFGGRTLAPEELPQLVRELRKRPPAVDVEVQSKWQLADTPADAGLFLVLVVVLLAGEWFLRKRWGLV